MITPVKRSVIPYILHGANRCNGETLEAFVSSRKIVPSHYIDDGSLIYIGRLLPKLRSPNCEGLLWSRGDLPNCLLVVGEARNRRDQREKKKWALSKATMAYVTRWYIIHSKNLRAGGWNTENSRRTLAVIFTATAVVFLDTKPARSNEELRDRHNRKF